MLALVVVRHQIRRIFTEQELEILDDKMPELSRRKKQDAQLEDEDGMVRV